MSVVLESTIGDITIDLFVVERPQACKNFLKLCKLKYYNCNLFHSVQRNFLVQTGDPTDGGKGGMSIFGHIYGEERTFFEAEKLPKLSHTNVGTVSLASHGNYRFGSQFFITLSNSLQYLDTEHCIFGRVVEGLSILDKFNDVICDQNHQPYQDIRITHTVVLDDPFEDPQGVIFPAMSPKITAEKVKSDRIAVDEILCDEHDAGLTEEQLDELVQTREAASRAQVLEMVGDLPSADCAPPENVLFVCKLNPVTNDDDLKVIFSRFGRVENCEIIRDHDTKASLQYAFVEFAERESCERAYLKMDNVLIDDRRIHVDFSQSVAKLSHRRVPLHSVGRFRHLQQKYGANSPHHRVYSVKNERVSRDHHRREDRVSRDRHRGEDRVSRDHYKREDRVSRDHHREEDRVSRDYHREEDRVSRDHHRDEDRVSRDHHREKDRVSRDHHREEDRVSRDHHREEDRVSRDRHRGEDRVSRDRHREEDRVLRDRHRHAGTKHSDNHHEHNESNRKLDTPIKHHVTNVTSLDIEGLRRLIDESTSSDSDGDSADEKKRSSKKKKKRSHKRHKRHS